MYVPLSVCVYSGGIWQPTCSGIARVSGAGLAWFANAAIEGIAQLVVGRRPCLSLTT